MGEETICDLPYQTTNMNHSQLLKDNLANLSTQEKKISTLKIFNVFIITISFTEENTQQGKFPTQWLKTAKIIINLRYGLIMEHVK